MKYRVLATLGASLLAGSASAAQEAALTADQSEFRDLFEELVETDTTLSNGSCTLAAERMVDRLRAAGLPEENLTLFATEDAPREGGMVAVYPGTSETLKPLLAIAHIDVVEAKREDWERDPFTLYEEEGYLYGRGVADDKAMAAVLVDTLIRFQKTGYRPQRTVKIALTCGEETNGAFNGVEWLVDNRRELIDAEFAINEGGGGTADEDGKVVEQAIQVGEKIFANYVLEFTNPGGHSSVPRPDNAITQLAQALVKIGEHRFPLEFNDTTRTYFRVAGEGRGDAIGDAMVALANDPTNAEAEAVVNTDPFLHSNLRTTCVATMLEAGHARNALAQRAQANVNCRIFPGNTIEEVGEELARIVDDEALSITILEPRRPAPPPPPMDERVLGPARELVERYFPGVPLVPVMSNGYTDSTFLTATGIPAYGVPGAWGDPDGNGVHGLNERISARSLYVGRDFLFDLIKAYASPE
ncbi:Acetylornithine deacetylase/Succinyl-diaminopimelate desuccinylase [Altererythrobacter xiamenensis]|uniref:Acetylornithine deacetylase/Succinyl-diaminopimelate desuccinylase n=1 Tax=Altererythrobacter xiamenensis TaxID=1316679 RepID=A0A1Y6FSK8_9SPHN|nr:M20/M25/M40 family metallo-hydrolase [Altererythrobacter xiamenensis]SMQ75852.1 Acetylornithine deacetylase/Succinyl-diaminopimelate desuccinylase [Altererythrobacter xiamenensis]